MALSKDQILEALSAVPNPLGGGDLVSADIVQWVATCESNVSIKVSLPRGADRRVREDVRRSIERAVHTLAAGEDEVMDRVLVEFVDEQNKEPAPARQPQQGEDLTAAVNARYIIAVGAGKGGVGKSTVAVNIAVGLARRKLAVGLLDGDIYGPSLPTMLGLDAMDQQVHQGNLQPMLVHGVKAISIGKMVDADKPLIWRGPMAHGAFKQLIERTDWGDLDAMVIDLPPGTGDVPLTLTQSLRLTGAVIVCTPQKVAQDDAVRAVRMFQQLGVEVLGVVENMSYFIGDDGKEYDIFGRGGAEVMAQRLNIPFLGAIPINMALRANSDAGDPSANFDPRTAGGDQIPRALAQVVDNLEKQMALASMRLGQNRPTLNIS
ncbi:MAG: ATP-binding protein [Phycisphaerales bacterium]|nr:ATP-binding protein [Phycisphaerales bacterium]